MGWCVEGVWDGVGRRCGMVCEGGAGWCGEEVWDGVWRGCGMVWGGGVGWCVEGVWDGVGRRCGGGVWKCVEVCGAWMR